jgi:hypothetical protein
LTGVRTVCGIGRQVQLRAGRLLRRWRRPAHFPAAAATLAPAERRPLLTGALGPQRRAGAVLDQVDGTTCGSAVLLAVAAWADPTELARLEGTADGGPRAVAGGGFGARFDARQKQVHRETNRFWPQALGTTPWGAARWLRDHVPAAGRHRVRLVDDTAPADVAALVAAVGAVLATGRPVPLLVGPLTPRHYVLALAAEDGGWRVYEPSSAQVRHLDPAAIGERRLAPVLGWDRLHAALLPS